MKRHSLARTATIASVASGILLAGGIAVERPAAAAPAFGLPSAGLSSPNSLLRVAFDYQVYQIQRELNNLGYDAGPVDGYIGSRTRTAIRLFQRDESKPVTGEPSARVLADLQATAAARSQKQQQAQQPAPQPQASTSASTATTVETQQIYDIQTGLRRLGYDVPQVSGEMDDRTKAAVRAYQQSQNLLVDGRVTEQLVTHIKQTAEQHGTMTDREKTMKVQEALNARGYSAGTSDGVMGNQTRVAIRTFQADAGTSVNGRVTPELLNLLGIAEVGAAAGASTDTQATSESDAEAMPEYRVVLSDDFSDGNITASPRWTVGAGDFFANNSALKTNVKIEAPKQGDIGKQLLKGIVSSALGVSLQGPQNMAAISSPATITDPFRIKVALKGSGGSDSRFSFGPYRGSDVSQGYRVEADASASRSLRLLLVNSSGASVIASANPGADLMDGQAHDLLWERMSDGSMTVSVDGSAVLQAKDQTYRSGFDGFSMINAGGDWQVDEVVVEAKK